MLGALLKLVAAPPSPTKGARAIRRGKRVFIFCNVSVSLPNKQLRGRETREEMMFDPDLNWIDTTHGIVRNQMYF